MCFADLVGGAFQRVFFDRVIEIPRACLIIESPFAIVHGSLTVYRLPGDFFGVRFEPNGCKRFFRFF